ncbi:VGR-related protein [Herbaspirillum rubrisubalbicans M1]|uniref:type VI secretion system Vgr family protein n=1 Tax=Herbaspirillum rubrisubalbicans TaxID=80842 RepID=UPI00073A04E7|nr:type VI secretion system Vgr family protein [Herbaspirillum rubrisubalbicans]ALU90523.1 VGR-related protein [Herbaspirillum rubrisubalbicans M1]
MDAASSLLSRLVRFSADSRLFRLQIAGHAEDRFLLQAYVSSEQLHGVDASELIVLSLDAECPLKSLIGCHATLETRLADGTRSRRTGLIHEAAKLGGDGGFCRYRLRMVPWPWLLGQSRTSRVWQDKSLLDVVEDVLRDFPQHADWTWSADALDVLTRLPLRSYTVQYRQTHLDFISRLLAGEGMSWRVEEHAASPQGHRLVFFGDSSQRSALAEDVTSAADGGIRFHGARAQEQQDSIQALAACRSLQAASYTLLGYDDQNKQAIAASIPTHHAFGGRSAPRLESYDSAGLNAPDDSQAADRHARLMMEAAEALNKRWRGRSTVRSLRAGSRFTLMGGPLREQHQGQQEYAVLALLGVGINQLPADTEASLAELFGPLPPLLEEAIAACLQTQPLHPDWPLARTDTLIEQARSMGYANVFEAIRADIPWRPVLADGSGLQRRPHALARGSQSAIVVGYWGETQANGPDEICCDRLGRVRIRFHWQGRHDDAGATCWVRVGQRCAGPGMGLQFLPRIGQEVLVQFIENDLERPIILGALYNGRGEGSVIPTPGGEVKDCSSMEVFAMASDTGISGQGNLAGTQAPTWHGASADRDGHRNPAAQWGIRSKEFGGWGYNQLLFDDSDGQGRLQFKTTQAGSELNLGHLIHSADNYRGSFRGTGLELRTDAYGVIRAGAGILFSSYRVEHRAHHRDPAADNTGLRAMARQAAHISKSFDEAARTHRTVGMSQGLDAMNAMKQAVASQAEIAGQTLPGSSTPLIQIAAKEGLGVVAGQHLQLANGSSVSLMAGQDAQHISGHQFRLRTQQAIGLLAGASAAGDQGIGLQMIAAQGDVAVQAQADGMSVQARDQLTLVSANAAVNWAAAKKISLSTAGGANITIEGGNITVQCPGELTVHAGQVWLDGPVRHLVQLPALPRTAVDIKKLVFNLHMQDIPGPHGLALAETPWRIVAAESAEQALMVTEKLLHGRSDSQGKLTLSDTEQQALLEAYNAQPGQLWLVYLDHVQNIDITLYDPSWSDMQKHLHALNAMGYSDDYAEVAGRALNAATLALARQETGKARGTPLLKQLKE